MKIAKQNQRNNEREELEHDDDDNKPAVVSNGCATRTGNTNGSMEPLVS